MCFLGIGSGCFLSNVAADILEYGDPGSDLLRLTGDSNSTIASDFLSAGKQLPVSGATECYLEGGGNHCDLLAVTSVLSLIPGAGEAGDLAGDAENVAGDTVEDAGAPSVPEDETSPQGFRSFSAAKRALPDPGDGNVYDHIVEQSQIGRSGFAPEDIHNIDNLDPVPAWVNQLKANYYSSIRDFTDGVTVRDWLTGQSFEAQRNFGLDVTQQILNEQIP